jgi:hypothetical protein
MSVPLILKIIELLIFGVVAFMAFGGWVVFLVYIFYPRKSKEAEEI